MSAIPYFIPNLTAIRAAAMTDITSADLTGSQPLLPTSILGRLAYAIAGQAFDLYGYIAYIARNATPWGASGEYLAAWAALKGVYRLPATAAAGSVAFAGTTGVHVPAGSLLKRSDGAQYATTADCLIGSAIFSGSLTVPVAATAPGSAGNAPAGIALALATPVNGVTTATTAATPLVGGADQELDASLRGRMLQAYAAPADGGSISQYKAWARQVPGCTQAWVNAGVAPGSVELYVLFGNTFAVGASGGATAETRIAPATGSQLLVANSIYPLRPVTALVYVATPVPAPVNFTIQALTPSTAAVEAAIAGALTDLFTRLASPLAGNAIYNSSFNAAIESVAGVNAYTLLSPIAPVSVPVGSLACLGTITYL